MPVVLNPTACAMNMLPVACLLAAKGGGNSQAATLVTSAVTSYGMGFCATWRRVP